MFIILIVTVVSQVWPYVKPYEIVYFKMCSVLNLNYSSVKLLKFCGRLESGSGTGYFVGTKKGMS